MSDSFRNTATFRVLRFVLIGLAILLFTAPFFAGLLAGMFPDTVGVAIGDFFKG